MKQTRLPSFKQQLQKDPDFIVAYMLDRDMPKVVDNLRGMGFVVNDPQNVYNALNQLIEQDPSGFINAFGGVDLGGNSAETGPDMAAALTAREVGRGFARMAKVSGRSLRSAMGPYNGADEGGGAAGNEAAEAAEEDAGGLFNFGGTTINWDDVGKALATGVLVLLGNNGQSTVNLDPNAQAQLQAAMAEQEKRRKAMMLWIVLGAVALLIAIILFVVLTKKKPIAA